MHGEWMSSAGLRLSLLRRAIPRSRSARGEPLEMLLPYLHLGNASPHPLQIWDTVDGIEFLNHTRLDVGTAETVETLAGQFAIIAQVGEKLILERQRAAAPHEVAQFAINRVAGATV